LEFPVLNFTNNLFLKEFEIPSFYPKRKPNIENLEAIMEEKLEPIINISQHCIKSLEEEWDSKTIKFA